MERNSLLTVALVHMFAGSVTDADGLEVALRHLCCVKRVWGSKEGRGKGGRGRLDGEGGDEGESDDGNDDDDATARGRTTQKWWGKSRATSSP